MLTLEEQYKTFIYLYSKRLAFYHQNSHLYDPTKSQFCWQQRELYQRELKKLLGENNDLSRQVVQKV